jgi:hypothetical protein
VAHDEGPDTALAFLYIHAKISHLNQGDFYEKRNKNTNKISENKSKFEGWRHV